MRAGRDIPCAFFFPRLKAREKEEFKLHGFFRAENCVYRCATDSALPFEGWFAIFHSHLLSILHLSFLLALDTVV